ncbi:MAG: hypothetical protein WKG00_17785, partial [Polyangiaceae bacterium]
MKSASILEWLSTPAGARKAATWQAEQAVDDAEEAARLAEAQRREAGLRQVAEMDAQLQAFETSLEPHIKALVAGYLKLGPEVAAMADLLRGRNALDNARQLLARSLGKTGTASLCANVRETPLPPKFSV